MFDTPPENLPVLGATPAPRAATPPPMSLPTPPPPSAPAAPVVDMFAGVEPPVAPTRPANVPPVIPPPLPPAPPQIPHEYLEEKKGFPIKKIIIGLVVVIVVGGGGYAAYLYGGQFINPSTTPSPTDVNTATGTNDVPTDTTNTVDGGLPVVTTPVEPDPATLDTDGDSLTDADESKLGTDSNNPDSDGDGLFDGEEVKTFHTDPLKKDTDADTFTDGAEVKSGYDPNGPGKLFAVPQE